jgi:hypothetical protein
MGIEVLVQELGPHHGEAEELQGGGVGQAWVGDTGPSEVHQITANRVPVEPSSTLAAAGSEWGSKGTQSGWPTPKGLSPHLLFLLALLTGNLTAVNTKGPGTRPNFSPRCREEPEVGDGSDGWHPAAKMQK